MVATLQPTETTAINTATIEEIARANLTNTLSWYFSELSEDDYGELRKEFELPFYLDKNGNYKLFNEVVKLQLWYLDKEGLFLVYSPYLNLFSTGKTESESVECFVDTILHDYQTYLHTPATNLTSDAKELLGKYKKIFGV